MTTGTIGYSEMRLITFDVTGTLLLFRTSLAKIYGEIGSRYGISCDENLLQGNFNKNFKKMVLHEPNFGLYSGLGWEKWWKNVVINTFLDSKCIGSDMVFNSLVTDLIQTFETPICWKHNHGCLELLRFLKAKNIKLGIISNFDPRLPNILKNMNIDEYFNFVLYSYEIGLEKPNCKIFNKALDLSGLSEFKACDAMHVGNSYKLDYQGAIQAGWKAVLISDAAANSFPGVPIKLIFPDLSHFHKYIIKSNEKSSKNFI